LSDPWVRVSFSVPAELMEAALAWVQEMDSLGAETRDIAGGQVGFELYFNTERYPESAAQQLSQALGRRVDVEIDSVPDDRWEEIYYQGLAPFPVGERFIIYPGDAPECGKQDDHRTALWIPPGRAFGTGDHATTALCIRFLERLVKPGDHVLDVGTGSGILALAAVSLGASRVVAVEVDPEAARVAAENFQRHEAGGRVELKVGTTAAVTGWFDVVAANLRSDILCRTMAELAHLLRPGGTAVLSGILEPEADGVDLAAQGRGLRVTGRSRGGEWVALELAKPA
jgi:ribosomal protein L11 methyltransferase